MATHSNIRAWKIHGQGKLEGYSPWERKELDVTKHAHAHQRASLPLTLQQPLSEASWPLFL